MPSTSLGFPYPALGDAPYGPTQMQALAQAVNSYILANVVPSTYIRLGRSATYTVLDDGSQHPINGWMDGILSSSGDIDYAGAGQVQINVSGEYAFGYQIQWPAKTSTSTTNFKRVGTLWRNGHEPSNSAWVGKTTVFVPAGARDAMDMAVYGVIGCSAGDLLTVAVLQTSGGAEVISPSAYAVWRVA